MFFWIFGHEACGILAPRPGIEPAPPALEVHCLNHWTTREVPIPIFLKWKRNFIPPKCAIINP